MAINILGLNAKEAILVRNQPSNTMRLKVNADEMKEKFQKAKENGEIKDLLELSGTSKDSVLSIKASADGPRQMKTHYSVDSFFRKDMPRIQNSDGTYSIDNVTFTKEELENARNVMKAAVSEFGPGKCTMLDYRDHAAFAIAENSVNAYAKEIFSEEQQRVMNKAMQEYKAGLLEIQNSYINNGKTVSNDYGEISKYYGLSPVFDEAMVDALNKMKEELSRITSRPFKPSVVGEASGIVSVATNQELISNITDVFKGVDLADEDAVKNAISKYNELVKPAYLANGAQAGSVNHINNWLNNDANKFLNLIANIRRSQLYKPMDVSV